MPADRQRPIESLEEARTWERLFIGEIEAGRDPRRPRRTRANTDAAPRTVADFLDAYMERCVKPAGLRSLPSVQSRVAVLKRYLGPLPLTALEEPDDINTFNADSDYAEQVEIATVHRALELLRGAMNWGMAHTPPLFRKAPFHRFGVRMNKKLETSRDRRLTREEEKQLLDTALQRMNMPSTGSPGRCCTTASPARWSSCAGGARCCSSRTVASNWETCQIGIPGETTKDKENRRVPFNPEGRLAAILKRRAALGPDAFVFGAQDGSYQPNIQTAWETLKLLANGYEPKPGRTGADWNREQLQRINFRWHDLRHEGACRLLGDGVDIRIIQLMLGHASIQQTQRYLNVTDEELRRGLEVSWSQQGRPLRLASGG